MRSAARAGCQLIGPAKVTVVIRWQPSVTARSGTRMARPPRRLDLRLGSVVYVSRKSHSLPRTQPVQRACRGRIPSSGPGWGFTVVLTGQDSFSSDQARGFVPTPQEFQCGVCATASADPHCPVDPGTVPKAMDVITPPGVSQATELDYLHAQQVTLQGCSS